MEGCGAREGVKFGCREVSGVEGGWVRFEGEKAGVCVVMVAGGGVVGVGGVVVWKEGAGGG